MSKCGGAIDKNIGAAALFTFIPWILIFGVMIAVLIIFPGFKGAFSDVIGYFVVSGSANDIFASILMGTDLNEMIEQTSDPIKQNELTKAAEAIVKICGNKSILINQMNPDNFLEIWDVLKVLMLPGSYENIELKEKLSSISPAKFLINFLMLVFILIFVLNIINKNIGVVGIVVSGVMFIFILMFRRGVYSMSKRG